MKQYYLGFMNYINSFKLLNLKFILKILANHW